MALSKRALALWVAAVGLLGAFFLSAMLIPLAVESEPILDIYTAAEGETSAQADRLYQQCKGRLVFSEVSCREKVVLLTAYNARVTNPYLPPQGVSGRKPETVGEAMDEQQRVEDGEFSR